MAKVNRCDRCNRDEVNTVANRDLPDGWERVSGVELCRNCVKLLHKFLEPIPTCKEG